jgi:hypothetical protein
MTEADFLERIAVELHELNTTLNCRLDAVEDVLGHLGDINCSLQNIAQIYENRT